MTPEYLYSFQIFLMLMVRITSIFMLMPVLSSNIVVVRYRLLFAFTVVLCIFPWAFQEYSKIFSASSLTLGVYLTLLLKEFLIGLVIGFFVSIVFMSFRLSSQFLSTQIGLGMSQVLDPNTQEEVPVFGFFFYVVGLLVFIVMGGLHLLIKAAVDSYRVLPVMHFLSQTERLFEEALKYFGFMFIIALKISFPIIAASLVVVFALGLIGKIAPQMNIMILGLPLQLSMGFLMIIMVMPFVVGLFENVITHSINQIMILLQDMRPLS